MHGKTDVLTEREASLGDRVKAWTSRAPLLHWMIFSGVSVFAAVLLWHYGLIQLMVVSDRTQISSLIALLYIGASLHCLWRTIVVSREGDAAKQAAARVVAYGRRLALADGDLEPPSGFSDGLVTSHIRNLAAKAKLQGTSRLDQTLLLRSLAGQLRGSNHFGSFASDTLMNAIIHDMTVEMARGDSMINPKFKTADSKIRTYDVVVANPMWNQPFNPDVFADGLHGRPRLQNTPPCREQRNSRRPGPGGEDGDLRCEDARKAARREGI